MIGFLSLIKPAGISSFGAVKYVKRIVKERVGHLGTLDPCATGVLPLAIGKATKLIPYINIEKKVYLAEITFGIHTDTLDSSGKILERKEFKHLTKEKLINILKMFIGEISQVPPKFSALKYKGKRFYQLVRDGIEVEPPKRIVKIKRIELLDFSLPKVLIKVTCSGGTYIRSLARDIGEAVDSLGCLSNLVRLEDGPFKLSNSLPLEEVDKNLKAYIKSPEEILNYSSLKFNSIDIDKIQRGLFLKIDKETLKKVKKEYFFAKNVDDKLVAFCKIIKYKDELLIKPCRVF